MESNSSEYTLYSRFARLVRVQTQLWNSVDARLRERHEVSLAQYTPLEVIATTDACRVRDIVTILHITVGGASKVVDRLELAGYVERQADPEDRRSTVLRVTPAGQRLLRAAALTVEELLEQRLASPLGVRGLASLDQALLQLERSGGPAVSAQGA